MEDIRVKDMSIIDMAEYIEGHKFTGKSNRLHVTEDMYKDFVTKLSYYDTAAYMLNYFEHYKDFFKSCSDFAEWFPKDSWCELFYAAKNHAYSVDVPADCLYLIKKAYNNISIPNLVFKQIPTSILSSWFEEGYLTGGYTLKDVVCSSCLQTYKPLSETRTKIIHNNFTEIYVAKTDMVAALPNAIGEVLSASDISKITLSMHGLHIEGKYLRTLAGFYGAVNSIYDLRRVY